MNSPHIETVNNGDGTTRRVFVYDTGGDTDMTLAEQEMITQADRQFQIGDVVIWYKASMGWGSIPQEMRDAGVHATIVNTNGSGFIVNVLEHGTYLVAKPDIRLANPRPHQRTNGDIQVLVDRYCSVHKGIAKEVRNQTDNMANDIWKLQEQIRILQADKANLHKLYESDIRRARKVSSDTRVYNMFETLLRDMYEEIKPSGLGITAITKPITITYAREHIDMGRYKIEIRKGDIKVYAIDDEGNTKGGYPHPHINSNGNICFGTWESSIYEDLASYDFVHILHTLYDFLCSVDKAGWYRDVRAWLPDADERCHSCWERECSCEEDTCSNCGEVMDNCMCDTCPSSGEVIPDGYPDHYCMNECRHGTREGDDGFICNQM